MSAGSATGGGSLLPASQAAADVLEGMSAASGGTPSHPRLGSFLGVPTPTAVVGTRMGHVQHLTPGLLSTLPKPSIFGVRMGEMLRFVDSAWHSGKPLRQFLNLGEAAQVLVTQRTPGTSVCTDHKDATIAFEAATGRVHLTPAEYVAAASGLRADAAVAPAFENPPGAGERRLATSARRSAAWWAACTAHAAGMELPPPPLLATVGSPTSPTTYHQQATAALSSGATGVVLGGLGLGEDAAFRRQAIAEAARAVASSEHFCPVVLAGGVQPTDILTAVWAGVDVVDSDLPLAATEGGLALTFSTWMPEWGAPPAPPTTPADTVCSTQRALAAKGGREMEAAGDCVDVGPAAGPSPSPLQQSADRPGRQPAPPSCATPDVGSVDAHKMYLNALDPGLTVDKRPLVDGCTCYACTHHTRAYVRHLLNTNEMLGPALLQVHNLHHFAQFFAAQRRAVQEGKWEAYCTWFVQANGGSVAAPDGRLLSAPPRLQPGTTLAAAPPGSE